MAAISSWQALWDFGNRSKRKSERMKSLSLCAPFDRHRHADYLTSIEILIIDQLDVLTMQNWDHVKVNLTSL